MPNDKKPSLEQLLHRPDIWRGHSSGFVKQETVDTGFPELNNALQHKGWPTGRLIEVCQNFPASEWWLFHRSIKTLLEGKNFEHMVLINPPILPFIGGLEQLGIPSQQIIIVQTQTPQEFVTSFTEINNSGVFPIVLAWQSKNTLHYNQLRKIQLSTSEQSGVYVLFSHSRAKENSSPASLRLNVIPYKNTINIHIFKQKGTIYTLDINLPIPRYWDSLPSHKELFSVQDNSIYETKKKGQISLFPKIRSRIKKELHRDYH